MSVAPDTTVALHGRFASDLPEMVVSWQAQTFPDPRLLALNTPLAAELGLDTAWLQSPDGLRFLVGNNVPDGATPVAQAYAGHQFGGYVPRLGDGRALLLGELVDADGRLHDIHLKGSGPTPFARGGDGLAAIGPMLREYLLSEGMHALGVPTTRALAVLSTGRLVQRETALPGGVLTRVAASHLRVGSFEYAAATGNLDLLRRLADHAISRHYPGAAMLDNPYLALFEAVAAVQASLVARWMLIGFVHGVMNTDNMTISGETIDYGPCAFMEAYHPDTVFSSIDHWGRYSYDNQPVIAGWNLARFAESLLPLLADTVDEGVTLAQKAFQVFRDQYDATWTDGMRAKLGLAEGVDAATVSALAEELLGLLKDSRADYTSFFRNLGRDSADHVAGIEDWTARWRALNPDTALMDRHNPIYIPRNHLVEEALTAATAGELKPLRQLLVAISAPYDERPGFEQYAAPAPEEFGDYRTFCGT